MTHASFSADTGSRLQTRRLLLTAAITLLLGSMSAMAQQAPADQGEGGQPAERESSLFDLEEVIVTGVASPGRTKYDSNIPISTFSEEEIERTAPMSTADLLSAVPGFWVESNSGTTQGNVFARGISQDGGYRYVSLQEDGIPIYPVSELSFYNPDQFVRVDAFIERVEAVRGGPGAIYAAGAVGGIVNFITRRPGDEPEALVRLTASDYAQYRGDFYASVPLDDGWGFAAGGYYRSSDGIRDPGYTADEGGQIHFNLTKAFDRGELEIFSKYINDQSLFVVPIPLGGSSTDIQALPGQDIGEYSLHSRDLAAAPLPPSAAEVGVENQKLEDGINPELFTIGAKLVWDFNETVSVTNVFRFTDGDVTFDGIFPGGAPVLGTTFAAGRGVDPDFTVLSTGSAFDETQLVQNHGHWAVFKDYEALQNDLRFNFDFGAHKLAVGGYWADYEMSDRWSLGNLLLMDVSDQPRRLLLPGVTDPNGFTQYSFFNLRADYDGQNYAFYASDDWQILDNLRIDAGVRYDDTDIDALISNGQFGVDLDGDPGTPWDNNTALAGPDSTLTNVGFNDWGYTVGLNFDLADHQGLFGRYTEVSKLPHFDDVRNNGPTVKRDNVKHIEFGYKALLPGIGVTITAFQTKMDNVPFNDILAGGQSINLSAGTRTRGVEIEGVLQPLALFGAAKPSLLDLAFGVTIQDPEYTNFTGDTVANTGNQIRRIPEYMLRFQPTLYLMDDHLRVFGTYFRVGERFANPENTIPLPSYFKLDLGAAFDFSENWSVQVKVDNVTDEKGLSEGNPRTDLGAAGLVGSTFIARPIFGTSFEASVTFRY